MVPVGVSVNSTLVVIVVAVDSGGEGVVVVSKGAGGVVVVSIGIGGVVVVSIGAEGVVLVSIGAGDGDVVVVVLDQNVLCLMIPCLMIFSSSFLDNSSTERRDSTSVKNQGI